MALSSNISSKHQDLVSRSIQISKGRPNVYQVKPTKEQFGTLTRMTVGEKNLNRPNRTVLLVGETGTGKSALINALFNHMMGVRWEEEVWFQLVKEENSSDQTQSQTTDVMVYQIFDFHGNAPPYSLTIIDTPGFGDTGEIERDATISQKLLDVFRAEDGVLSVHAVGLVVKSTDNRLSDRLLYVFNSVTSLFGKDIVKNIVALVTHSDGATPENALKALEGAKIKWEKNEDDKPIHFLFNNQQKTERKQKNERSLKHAWETSEIGMDQFTTFLHKVTPQELGETIKVLNERIRLTACIQNLQERIRLIELKRTEIQQKQEAVREYEEKAKNNENFRKTVDEPYKDKEDIDGGWGGFLWLSHLGAVNCLSCEETCHYPGCTVAWMSALCKVMKDGRCTVCSEKCPVSSHVKDTWRYVTKTRKVSYTNENMKREFEKNKKAGGKEENLLEMLRNQEKKMMEQKRNQLDEAYQHVISLDLISLNVNSVSTYVHYDFLIQEMKERGDQERKVQRLEQMKRRGEAENQSAAGYLAAANLWTKMKGITSWWKK